jgi:hypothetical protein
MNGWFPPLACPSQSELPVAFWLGKVGKKITIHWHDGSKQDILDPKVDMVHKVEQEVSK